MQETCKLPPTVGFAPVSRFARGLFGVVEEGEDVAVEFYNAWKDAVIAEVPKDCLLIFQVKDGWNPLCEYLGVESPSTPFPRMNDTRDVDEQHDNEYLSCYLGFHGRGFCSNFLLFLLNCMREI